MPVKELHQHYTGELGGLDAVPTRQPGQVMVELQLSAVGEFLFSLVDGQRTIRDICEEAKKKRGLTEFEVCRILYQFMSKGMIKT